MTVLEGVGFVEATGFFHLDGGWNTRVVKDVEKLLIEKGFPVERVIFTELELHAPNAKDYYQMIESILGRFP
ncbi:MAG: hypothetical protein ACFFCO_04240, partial [Promethearchaeota archaeon]